MVRFKVSNFIAFAFAPFLSIGIVSTKFKKQGIKHKSGFRIRDSGEDIDESNGRWSNGSFNEGCEGAKGVKVSVGFDEP